MFKDQSLDLSQLMPSNPLVSCKDNRIKPVLALASGRADMNVSRLGRLVRIKMEAKWADSQHGWHKSILPQNSD